MNFLGDIKPRFKKNGSDTLYSLEKECRDGTYTCKDGGASLAVTRASEDGLTAVYIKAALSKEGEAFASDLAVALEIPTIGEISGYMANYQSCANWCRPFFGTELTEIPKNTQALLYKIKNSGYGFILPIVGEIYKATLRGSEGGMELCLMSNIGTLSSCDTLAFICGEGSDPYKLMDGCARLSMKLLNNGASVRSERRYPEIFEYLGWCSWDALEVHISTAGLLEKCEEIKQKNLPIKWAILDDMWAECDKLRDIPGDLGRSNGMFELQHASKLSSFEADPKRFPTGLADCLAKMKAYGLKIGMWHPIGGYWSGIDPESALAEKYADLFITTPEGLLQPNLELGKLYTFYNEFHTFLKECGADFVKIDNQGSIMKRYKDVCPIGKAARTVQRAISSSVGANFDNDIINCMGMANENMFNRPAGAISRCSGDFQPENREWFIRHILACAYNSLIQGMFYWSDWDMWWTDDDQAKKNSVLRAISGGPIYVSDKIGRSRPEVFEPLCYSDGRILRCAVPAVPTADCLVCDPETSGRIFKVRNTYEKGGVIAAFNLDKENRPVSGRVSALDLELDLPEYAVYEHFTGEVKILRSGESLDVTLADHDDFRLYTIVPVENGVAVLGLIDKFNSPLAVTPGFAGVYALYEGGRFAFAASGDRGFTVASESGERIPEKHGMVYFVDLPLSDRHVKIEV